MRVHINWIVNDDVDAVCAHCRGMIPRGSEGLYASGEWYCAGTCAREILNDALVQLQQVWYKMEEPPMSLQQVGKDIIGGKVKKSAMAASISKKFFPNVKVSLLSEEEED